MAVRRRGAGFRRGVVRQTDWARTVTTAPTTLGAGSKSIVALITPSIGAAHETIRRTRGLLEVTNDQNGALEAISGAFGMVIVNDLAAGVGSSAIPGPFTDANDEGWFVWLPFLVTGDNNFGSAAQGRVFEFDSKAMRKLVEGFQIAVMVENASGSIGLRFQVGFSILASRG